MLLVSVFLLNYLSNHVKVAFILRVNFQFKDDWEPKVINNYIVLIVSGRKTPSPQCEERVIILTYAIKLGLGA